MLVLTNAQMREADKFTIESKGVPALTLMEKAGLALAQAGEKLAPSGKILCVCGGGNNGGDGFVCARLLKEKGRDVSVVSFAEKYSEQCAVNLQKWKDIGGTIEKSIPETSYSLVVDCLFGTGFHGVLEEENAKTVDGINVLKQQGAKVLSADIPSGVNGKNGKVNGVAVRADETLCIGEIKTGVLLNDGMDYAGRLTRVDIGIQLPDDHYAILTDKDQVRGLLPVRKRNSHKGTYGRAAIVAGSEEYTGAAYLSAVACLRAGAGYTTLFIPKDLLPLYALKSPEILLKWTNEGGRYAFNEDIMRGLLDYNSIAYGMGMGVTKEVFLGAQYLLTHYEGRLVLDADGLNSLALYGGDKLDELFAKKKCDVMLTPHIREFSRLSGLSVDEVAEDSLSLAQAFARKHSLTLLLKNALSILTDGERTALNATGNSGQAKGGSGDVLAGVLAGLCAMGLSTYESGVVGAYLVGKSAELASLDFGEYCLTASDLIAYLPKAFLFVTKNADEGCKQ